MSVLDILVFAINSVLPIILLVALGYFLKIRGLFSKEFISVGNKLVFRLLLPMLLFVNIAKMDDFSEVDIRAVAFAFAAIILLLCVGFIMVMFVKDPKQKGVILQTAFRSNFALIGVPLSQLIAGDEGVRAAALISAFSVPTYNVLGVIALTVFLEDNANTEKTFGQKCLGILRGIVSNPLIIGVLSGVALVAVKIFLGENAGALLELGEKYTFISNSVDYLAKAATPMSLLVLGGQFEFKAVKELRNQIIIGSVGRLIISPVIGIGGGILLECLNVLHFDKGVWAALVSLYATPVAVASAIMAEQMNNDGQLAAQLVVWTTLLSSFVIFVVVMILRALCLV